MTPPGVLHAVLPSSVYDPSRPTGGNIYDQRVVAGLAGHGWMVRELFAAGAWPTPAPADRAQLAAVLAAIPDAATVLVDGLVGCAAPEALVPESRRLRQVLLVHLPLGAVDPDSAEAGGERAVLSAAHALLVTSEWTGRWLLDRYQLGPDRVAVAVPGVDRAPPAEGTGGGGALLCVGPVGVAKGHDLLLAALRTIADLPWRCRCVGSLDRDPVTVGRLRDEIKGARLADRVSLAGPLSGPELDAAYAGADLLVHPSRGETYGMVLAEALARGVPVIAASVGGVREAIDGAPHPAAPTPGLVVPPGDAAALAGALRLWLTDPGLRDHLRAAALRRRETLPTWPATVSRIHRTLMAVAG